MYNVTLRRVRELLLPWKSNKYYIFVWGGAVVRVTGRAGGRACSFVYPIFNSYGPYCNVICGPFGSTIFCDII